jgi:hypothetical protein
MRVEETKKNIIVINNLPSGLNLEILIELIKQSTINNKHELLDEWEELSLLEIKKNKDYEIKGKVDMFKIKLIELLVFAHSNTQ